MRVVLQRVSRASVRTGGRIVGQIDHGLLALVGFAPTDDENILQWMADKVIALRLFPDDEQKMNRSLVEMHGALLVVSQFTLYGDVSRGRRPSFVAAAPPEQAESLYDRFVAALRERGVPVATGAFGAMMEVELINDGPVTLVLER